MGAKGRETGYKQSGVGAEWEECEVGGLRSVYIEERPGGEPRQGLGSEEMRRPGA